MPVVDLDLTRRFPYAGGRVFGDVGAYEQIDAVLTFAVDPSAEVNLSIVDLEHAPRGTDGRVRFTADFSVVRPVNPDRASHLLLVELPNRGRRRVVDTLNLRGKEAAASSDPGDGFLFERASPSHPSAGNGTFTPMTCSWVSNRPLPISQANPTPART